MTDTPTPLDLEALKTLAEQATHDGPWVKHYDDAMDELVIICDDGEFGICPVATMGQGEADADYLLAVQPSTVLALLSALGAFREEIVQMRDAYSADTRLARAYTEVLARLDARVRLPEKEHA